MKPFDLEAALKGAKVVTKCGHNVKIAGYNPDAHLYQQVVGWMGESAMKWSKKGEYSHNDPFELYMAEIEPTERKEWIVRIDFNNPEMNTIAGPFMMKEKAIDNLNEWNKAEFKATIHEITIIE